MTLAIPPFFWSYNEIGIAKSRYITAVLKPNVVSYLNNACLQTYLHKTIQNPIDNINNQTNQKHNHFLSPYLSPPLAPSPRPILSLARARVHGSLPIKNPSEDLKKKRFNHPIRTYKCECIYACIMTMFES